MLFVATSLQTVNILLDPVLNTNIVVQNEIEPVLLIIFQVLRKSSSQLSYQQDGLVE